MYYNVKTDFLDNGATNNRLIFSKFWMYILMDVRNINCTSSTRSNNDRFILFWIIPSASRSSEKIIIQILVRKWWSEKRWPLEKRDRIVTMCGLDIFKPEASNFYNCLNSEDLFYILFWVRQVIASRFG